MYYGSGTVDGNDHFIYCRCNSVQQPLAMAAVLKEIQALFTSTYK